jgi:hypothetical protein
LVNRTNDDDFVVSTLVVEEFRTEVLTTNFFNFSGCLFAIAQMMMIS